MRTLLIPSVILSAIVLSPAVAQETVTLNDVRDQRTGAIALTGATIQVDPETTLNNATVLIEDGQIVAVGSEVEIPRGFVVRDLSGKHIIPGLIDAYTAYGLPDPEPPKPFSFSEAEVVEPQREGAYNANDAIRSDYRAADDFNVDAEKAKDLRKLGFTAGLTFMADGLARGSAALVALGDGSANEMLLSARAAAMYSFRKGSSAQSYPISMMGSVAVLRQTYMDASWYQQLSPKPFTDRALDGWIELTDVPQIFETSDWQGVLRADRIGDEFGVQYIIRGSGDEYQRIDAITSAGAPLIVPLKFPKAPDVGDPLQARDVDWTAMTHWELAPTNPAALESAGITFALTHDGDDKFMANLRKAVEMGLTEATALASLTTVPAQLLGASDQLGTLAAGKSANLVVLSGPWLEEDSNVEETWVLGERYEVDPTPADRSGEYALEIGRRSYDLSISGEPGKPKAELRAEGSDPDADPIKGKISFDDTLMTLSFDDEGPLRLSGWLDDGTWSGHAQLPDGHWADFTMETAVASDSFEDDSESDDTDAEAEPDEDQADEDAQMASLRYPFSPYGWIERPAQDDVLFQNATVWTLEGDGVIEGADVLVRGGKIVAVGANLDAGDAMVIDATGKHLTPGIIDEHAHIALSAVNDVATNSSMVRMSDVVNSEDVNIYRNLAGGVTAAQLLHGSANPVGGQSALVKFRWGASPEEMLIEDADGFIKFALGENVKRSRNPNSIRYPQTRMGVEQVFRDGFSRAQEYQQAQADYAAMSRRERQSATPPRRDLVLDAMSEILNGERFISCHSYVQSEINMLMHVAEDFDFRVNTFTHILEGYKVADKMAAHGAGGSTFADWWAYKWEVRYAIPYNAALMTQAGVTVAINSDSREMSRRLNQEAAKGIKYGDMSEIEALKLVTLNPAKLLHLDDRMGSIAVGKDADLVLWSDHPLSIYAQAEKTLVDGRVMFDLEQDRARRDEIRSERARLIAKALEAGENGGGGGNGRTPSSQRVFECESITGYEHLTALRQ